MGRPADTPAPTRLRQSDTIIARSRRRDNAGVWGSIELVQGQAGPSFAPGREPRGFIPANTVREHASERGVSPDRVDVLAFRRADPPGEPGNLFFCRRRQTAGPSAPAGVAE